MWMRDVAGRVAGVTGGASGIGRARFWIHTQPELMPAVRRRCENGVEERDPTPPKPRAPLS
jgi:hypothetical protein